MVVKTDLCSYTEYKIYPGHGQKFVGKDAKISVFITAKADSLFHQKIKAVRLTWTQGWRRMHKKGRVETAGRRKKMKATKFQKAVGGMSLDDILRRKNQREEFRNKALEDAKAEIKKRSATKKTAPKANVNKTQQKAKMPVAQNQKAKAPTGPKTKKR